MWRAARLAAPIAGRNPTHGSVDLGILNECRKVYDLRHFSWPGVRKLVSQTTVNSWKSIEKAAAHLELGRQLENHAGAVVLEARQLDVNRRIHVRACPLGKSGLGSTPEQVKGTVAKLRSLSHPGLAKIYGGGAADGMAYLETEPVRGLWPDELATRRRLTPRQKLELTIRLCETLAYLNSQGIRYGALAPRGLLIQRQLGALRFEPKLVRYESMRGFKSDGADQRAFAEFVATLLSPPGNNDSDLDRKLRALAAKCASATANLPTFAELLLILRQLLVEQTAAAASPTNHLAEPLRVEIPPPKVKPDKEKESETPSWIMYTIIGVGTIVALITAIIVIDRFPDTGPRPKVVMPARTYRPPPPTMRREPTTGQPRTLAPSGDATQQPLATVTRERSYRFMPAMRHSAGLRGRNPSTGNFARPRSWGPELEEDAIAISEPAWTKGTFGAPALSVRFSCTADLGANSRIMWVIESNGKPQYEARLFPGITGDEGMLKGEITTISTSRLDPPLTTYLAEDSIGFGEPRRVSNILTIPEASEE
jgi:hypothetical protein